jgi:hypothetical protein
MVCIDGLCFEGLCYEEDDHYSDDDRFLDGSDTDGSDDDCYPALGPICLFRDEEVMKLSLLEALIRVYTYDEISDADAESSDADAESSDADAGGVDAEDPGGVDAEGVDAEGADAEDPMFSEDDDDAELFALAHHLEWVSSSHSARRSYQWL